MSESPILDKIKALLAKAESSEFPEEAEALSAKATELMAKHRIEQGDLADGEDLVTVDVPSVDLWGVKPDGYLRSTLLGAICHTHGVYSYQRTFVDITVSVVMIGRKETIEMCIELFKILDLQADQVVFNQYPAPKRPEPNRAYIDIDGVKMSVDDDLIAILRGEDPPERPEEVSREDISNYRRNLLAGFCYSVVGRMKEAMAKVEDEAPGYGLMVLSDYQKAAASCEEEVSERDSSEDKVDKEAMLKGVSAGRLADIGQTKVDERAQPKPRPRQLGW